MAQLINVTSEALQATIRRLLPSQQGFGEDLQAQNVIIPTIDLTATAEGSALPTDLARALALDSNTGFAASGSTAVIANTSGFWQISATVVLRTNNSSLTTARLQLTDGSTTINVWEMIAVASADEQMISENLKFIVFLDTNDSVQAVSSSADCRFSGSSRQVADRYGNITNPAGFNFE